MDWLLVAGIGAIFGGFYGIGIAVFWYACFWAALFVIIEATK